MSVIGRKKRVAVEIGGGGSVLSARALADDDEPNVVEVEYVPASQLTGAVAALHEVIRMARDFSRCGISWQEYDRQLAAVESAYPRDMS